MAAAPILLLDNKDSFVWNLAQALQILGADVCVERSDRISVGQIRSQRWRALVLSPGPGRPEDAGVCVAAVRHLHATLPILGVCLGHQVIGAAFGGVVDRGPPCHGKAWPVLHTGSGLFAGLPSPLHACRYHSLAVEPGSLPGELVRDAWTHEGVLMGLRHRRHPLFGVQFHPESFLTEHGPRLLANFLEACA